MQGTGSLKVPIIGLRKQALKRLLLVMLAAAVSIGIIANFTYTTMRGREADQIRDSLRHHYQLQLPQMEALWKNQAEELVTRIEHSRNREEPAGKQSQSLSDLLDENWRFLPFESLIILSPSGEVLHLYGQIMVESHSHPLPRTYSDWFHDPDTGQLFRVFSHPLQLPGQPDSNLVLLKRVDASVLNGIASPDTQLILMRAADQIAHSMRSDMAKTGQVLEVTMPWPGTDPEQAVGLRILREMPFLLTPLEFAPRPFMALVIILALLWFVLGRWLGRTVKRIVSLEAATRVFAETGRIEGIQSQLLLAQQEADEIHQVAVAMADMMHTVDERSREQQAYMETLAMLEEAVLELDPEGVILRASPGWEKLIRQPSNVGAPLQEFIHEDDLSVFSDQCQLMKTGEKHQTSFRLRLKGHNTGDGRWVECRLVSHNTDQGGFTGIRGVLRDITQTYLNEKQISHMALHDALTGLPNRVLLEDRIRVALRQASRSGGKVGVCFIDLDNFKNVNDALGHKSGDKLLLAFSKRLGKVLRAGDTLARWGGDEFVLLLPNMLANDDLREVASKLKDANLSPLDLEATQCSMTCSVGVAVYPDDGDNLDTLLAEADRAMFFAKSQGRNRICFYGDISHKERGHRDLYIQSRLASAIQAGRIQAWFQPIISAATGKCMGAEVLARWHEDDLGWVSPTTFIPMAENQGLIQELGDQVWAAGLVAASTWRQQGRDMRLAVNISKRQLFHHGFTDKLLGDVASHGLSPESMILEVTESIALMDVENAGERLSELSRAGFSLAIDDFGTGYSSLSQLHEMPVSELKIDMSFVRRLNDPNGLSMVQAIIGLARTLNLQTIAEGVEDAATAEKLRSLGADCLQGYYFAKPMPLGDFDRWLANETSGRTKVAGN